MSSQDVGPGMRQLRLLGLFRFSRDGDTLVLPHSCARLVALLALNGPASRRHVIDQLWPDADPRRGSASLRTALSRINAVDGVLVEGAGEILSVPECVHTDLDEVTAWVGTTIYATATQAITSGPPASTGKQLLPGWEEPWLAEPRERLRLLQTQALETAAERLIAAGRAAEALPYALAAVHSQPWSESANRLLIEIHARRGDPSNALRRFRHFQAALEAELGVQPGPDILAVMRQLYPFGGGTRESVAQQAVEPQSGRQRRTSSRQPG